MYQLLFKTEASESIGLGHVKRCLTLAGCFRQHDFEVYFSGNNDMTKQLVSDAEFSFIHTDDQDCFYRLLKKSPWDILILDTYNTNKKELDALRTLVPLVIYIDDLCKFDYPVDVVINGNIYAEALSYVPSEEKVYLLGLKYNLLSDAYSNLPIREVPQVVKDILITTGGTDNSNLTERLINWIRSDESFDAINLHVVIGSGFKSAKRLKALKYQNVLYYENRKSLAELMQKADMAISSSGSTLYELCASGVPTLSVIIAENQTQIAETMDNLGLIKCLGWDHQLSFPQLKKEVEQLISNFDERANIIKRQQQLLDGQGPERIVKRIKELISNKKEGDSYE